MEQDEDQKSEDSSYNEVDGSHHSHHHSSYGAKKQADKRFTLELSEEIKAQQEIERRKEMVYQT